MAGDATIAAAEAIDGIVAATIRETNRIAAYSDDAASACSAKDVTDPTYHAHTCRHRCTTRKYNKRGDKQNRGGRKRQEKGRNTPQKLRGKKLPPYIITSKQRAPTRDANTETI